jgi:hypothetical protein
MIRRPVTSTNVSSVGWEAHADEGEESEHLGTLEVEFLSGRVYQYENVPEEVYQAMLGATSVGRYLNDNIIGQFDEQRIS